MVAEIPLRLLVLRATVKRYSLATGEYSITIYTDLPGRLANHYGYNAFPQDHISSEVELPLFICRYYFEGVKVDIRMEDRIIIGTEKYRVLKVTNAESANHHFEISVEHLKTVETQA